MSIKRKVSETYDSWLRIPSSDKANHMVPDLHDQMFLTNPRGIFTLESCPVPLDLLAVKKEREEQKNLGCV